MKKLSSKRWHIFFCGVTMSAAAAAIDFTSIAITPLLLLILLQVLLTNSEEDNK